MAAAVAVTVAASEVCAAPDHLAIGMCPFIESQAD